MLSLKDSPNRRVKLTIYQIYTFLFKFQKQFQKKFPNVDIHLGSRETLVYSDTQQACIEAEKKIRYWVTPLKVEVIKVHPDLNMEDKEIKAALSKIDTLVFQNAQIKRQLKELNQMNLMQTKAVLHKALSTGSQNVIMIVPWKHSVDAKKILTIIPKPVLAKGASIDLKLNAKKTLASYLLGLLYIDNYKIKLINIDDTLWIGGNQELCEQFEKRIHMKLNDLSLILYDASELLLMEKIKVIKFGANAFMYDRESVKKASQTLKQQYGLEGPAAVYKQLEESKPYFLLIVCPKDKDSEVRQILEEAAIKDSPPEVKRKTKRKKKTKNDQQSQRNSTNTSVIEKQMPKEEQNLKEQKEQKKRENTQNEKKKQLLKQKQRERQKEQERKKQREKYQRQEREKQLREKDRLLQIQRQKQEQSLKQSEKQKQRQNQRQKQRQTTSVVKSLSIQSKHFKQLDFKQFIQANNIIEFQTEIEISADPKSAQTIISLRCPQTNQTQKKKNRFNEYFQSERYCFQRQMNSETVDKIVATLTQKYPKRLLKIQYIKGWSCYSYNQIQQNYHMQMDLIDKIKSRGIQKSKDNTVQFYSFVISGLRPFVVEREDKLRDMIKIMEIMGSSEQQLSVPIPKKVIDCMGYFGVEDYIKKYSLKLIEQSLQQPNFSPRLDLNLKSQNLTCQTQTSSYVLRQDQIQRLKVKFETMFDSFDSQNISEKKADIKQLQRLYKDTLFIKSQPIIIMIGFNLHKKYVEIKNKFAEKSKVVVINYPLHLKEFLRANISSDTEAVTFSDNSESPIITVQGTQTEVLSKKAEIEQLIQKGNDGLITHHIRINRQLLAKLNSKGGLKGAESTYSLKVETNQKKFQRHLVEFKNGNKMYLMVGVSEKIPSYKMCTTQKEFSLISDQQHTATFKNFQIDKSHKCFVVEDLTELVNVYKKIGSEEVNLYLDKTQVYLVSQAIGQYTKNILFPITIHLDAKSYRNSVDSIQAHKQQSVGKVEYGWIQNGSNCPYTAHTQTIISNKVKNKQTSFVLNQMDMEIKQHLFEFNRKKLVLTYKRTGKQYPVVHDTINRRYTVQLNGKVYGILQSSYRSIQNIGEDEMSVTTILYHLDLLTMTQTNLFTQFKRKMYQNTIKQEKAVEYSIKPSDFISSQIGIKYHPKHKQSITSFKKILKSEIDAIKVEQTKMELNTKILSQVQFMNDCQEKEVSVKIESVRDHLVSVLLRGYDIRTLKEVIHDYMIKEQSVNRLKISTIQYPKHWLPQTEPMTKTQVAGNTDQFRRINAEFAIAQIKKLYKIQNKIIWKKYAQEKIDLETTTEKTIKQLFLFHGTRAHNPEQIYFDKQEAFNINLSSDNNYFGRGIYFAKHAKYSQGYSYQSPTGRQMLYCRVMVGNSQVMDQSQSSSQIKDTNYCDERKKIKYESIMSTYGGTDVYIIYKSRRAYPEYLIEF